MPNSHLPRGNAAYINKLNKIKILNLIHSRKEVSRADLVREVGLSAPTVTRVVESLINNERLVVEVGTGDSQGGRPPILVKFNGTENYVIGVDLGTTSIRGALADLNARIIKDVTKPTNVESGANEVIKGVGKVISELIDCGEVDKSRILGVGLAVAGLIDRDMSTVEFSPDFNWRNVDVKGPLQKQFSIPIIFDNVTRVMSLGELWYGIGEKVNNFICVNVGYGIGAGVIIDGKPLYGASGKACEFGHVRIERESKIRCKCGKTGCLEALSSGNSIARIAREEISSGRKSILQEMCSGDPQKITAELVVEAAKKGDRLALEIFEKSVDYLGMGIAGLINIFDPGAVVIGGGVSQAGDILFDRLREKVRKDVLYGESRNIEILPVKHGLNATVMGSVAMVLNEILNFKLTGA